MSFALWMILGSVVLNAAAQVLLKMGVGQVKEGVATAASYVQVGLHVFGNPSIASGVVCYGVSLLCWLRALSEVELSYGVPILSLSYVLTALAGVWFFQESLTFARIFGIGLIIGGVCLVAKTA